MKFFSLLTSLMAVAGAQASPVAEDHQLIKRASLTQVQNFGNNPSGIKMFIYVPAKLQAKPPVVLVLHACAWTAGNFFGTTKYGQLADQHGYVLIFGQTPTDGACWDVSSTQSLTHDGGSDSTGLANMVRYALRQYNGDPSRVFVTGESSGAMMTQVMAAAYPDLFAAASEFSGEPAGCFFTGTVRGWNGDCAGGKIRRSPAEWATVVRNMYPSYTGQYPRMQVYHGDVDTTLNINSFNESIKEWSGIFGYSGNANQAINNNPGSRLTRYIYGDRLQGIWGHGIGHVVPTNETEALQWFGIIPGANLPPTTAQPPASTQSSASSQAPPASTAPPNTGNCAAKWGQCGGSGWSGPTCCQAGSTCTSSNTWYSQCI
jgi:acetylxylan esterase